MTLKNKRFVCWVLLAIGILASLVLLVSRISAESKDKNVSFVISYTSVMMFARHCGMTEAEWLASIKDSGIEYVIYNSRTAPEADVARSLGFEPAMFSIPESGDWAFIHPHHKDVPTDTSTPIALIELNTRMGIAIGDEFSVASHEGDMVKTFYCPGHPNFGLEEEENMIFRAVVERGNRLVILRPILTEDGHTLSDPDIYVNMLNNLTERFERYGLTVGEGFSCMNKTLQSPILYALASCLPAALWILLLGQIPYLRKYKEYEAHLCILVFVGLIAAHLIFPGLCQKLLPFASAAVFPCIAVLVMRRLVSKHSGLPLVWSYLAFLACLLAWGLLGGLSVSALMAHPNFVFGEKIFSGVKAAEIIPLVLCFVLFALPVFEWIKTGFSKKRLIVLASAAVVAAVVLYVAIKRSGDVATISTFETALRSFLENALYARPRTKELFFAAPATAVFIFGMKRNNPLLTIMGAECAALECVSLINTFCHATAPIIVSLARGVLGAALGAVIGLVILAVLHLVFKKIKL